MSKAFKVTALTEDAESQAMAVESLLNCVWEKHKGEIMKEICRRVSYQLGTLTFDPSDIEGAIERMELFDETTD